MPVLSVQLQIFWRRNERESPEYIVIIEESGQECDTAERIVVLCV